MSQNEIINNSIKVNGQKSTDKAEGEKVESLEILLDDITDAYLSNEVLELLKKKKGIGEKRATSIFEKYRKILPDIVEKELEESRGFDSKGTREDVVLYIKNIILKNIPPSLKSAILESEKNKNDLAEPAIEKSAEAKRNLGKSDTGKEREDHGGRNIFKGFKIGTYYPGNASISDFKILKIDDKKEELTVEFYDNFGERKEENGQSVHKIKEPGEKREQKKILKYDEFRELMENYVLEEKLEEEDAEKRRKEITDIKESLENGEHFLIENKEGEKCIVAPDDSKDKYSIYRFNENKPAYPKEKKAHPRIIGGLPLQDVMDVIKKHKFRKSRKLSREEKAPFKRDNASERKEKASTEKKISKEITTEEQFAKEFYPAPYILEDEKRKFMFRIANFRNTGKGLEVFIESEKIARDGEKIEDRKWMTVDEFRKMFDREDRVWVTYKNRKEYEAKKREEAGQEVEPKEESKIELTKKELEYIDIFKEYYQDYFNEFKEYYKNKEYSNEIIKQMRPEEERYFWQKDLPETIREENVIKEDRVDVFIEKIKK